MRIRTQLLGTALLAGCVAVGAGISVWQSLRDTEAAENEQSRATATAREVAKLLVVTQEYAFRPDAGTDKRWRASHQSLVLTMGFSGSPDEADGGDASLDGLRSSAHRLPVTFGRLGASVDDGTPLAARRRAFLFDQLLTDTQLVADSAYRWSRDAAERHGAAARSFERKALVALALVLLTLVGQVVFVFRRVLQPLRALERATVAIERGDLNVALNSDSADEVGHLARRFDEMTLALKDRSEELNQEIELRRKSEKRMRTVADSLPVLVAYVDKHQMYRFANAHFRSLLGIDPAALLGQSIRQHVGDLMYARLRPHICAALAGETVHFDVEEEVDGGSRHSVVDYIPDLGEDGKVEGFYMLVVDITERKRIEMRQALDEERVRSILTHAPDAFIGLDEAGRIAEWNEQAQLTFGWTREEVLGRGLVELVVPEPARAEYEAGIEQLLRSGHSTLFARRCELTALHRDGREVPVELSMSVQRHGERFIANAFLHDISERRSAAERMAASRKRLRDITDNIPALIGYFDARETCQFLNESATRLFGLDSAAAIGQPMALVLGEKGYAGFAEHVREVLAGRRVRFDGASAYHGREELSFQAHLIPDLDEGGEVCGFYAMAFDVTVLKHSERLRAAGEARLKTITDNLPVLISYIDQQERLCFANGTYREWMGLEPEAIIGRRLPELIGPVLYAQRRDALHRALSGERVSFEIVSEARGVRRHLSTTYLPDVGSDGRVAGIYALSADITAAKEVERQLNDMARVDLLTGLANARQLQERLDRAFSRAQRSARMLAVFFITVGEFDGLLTHLGSPVVNALLREVAHRLRVNVRLSDTVARLGEAEFVLVAEGLQEAGEAELIRDKVHQVLRAPVLLGSLSLELRVDTGVAVHRHGLPEAGQAALRSDTIVGAARRAALEARTGELSSGADVAGLAH